MTHSLSKLFVVVLVLSACAKAVVKRDIEYGRADHVPLLLDAYILDSPGSFATVIYVHGGGFTGGDKKGVPKPLLDLLVQAGFNLFSVNYRLAPRYPFPAETNDVERAVQYVKTHAAEYRVDPNRIALMGASAGGHLVSFVGVEHKPENRVAAVVSFYGEHDLVSRTRPQTDCAIGGHIRHTDEPQPCLSDGLKAFLGVNGLNPSTANIIREASPITYVSRDMPSYLLIHGTKDLDVPYEQSVLMCDAMKKAGARCEIITVEGGGHGGWDKDPVMQRYQQSMMEWLKKNL